MNLSVYYSLYATQKNGVFKSRYEETHGAANIDTHLASTNTRGLSITVERLRETVGMSTIVNVI